MYLIVDAASTLLTRIVPLRGKHKVMCELRVTVDCLNTFHYVPVVELQALSAKGDVPTLERRAAR
jgi:hypothetical protein